MLLLAIEDEQLDVSNFDDRGQRPQKGIITRPGRHKLYKVLIVISNMELFSGGTADLAKAVDLHIALTAVKRRVTKDPALIERLDEEVRFALQDQDVSASQACLRLRVHIPVHHWTGCGLRSPTYSWSGLETALALRKRLQKSRLEYTGLGAKKGGIFFLHTPASVEQAWQMLSKAYIDAWAAAGWDEQSLRTRLHRLRSGHAVSNTCQLTAWNQYRMECEDRRMRLCQRVMCQCEARERRHMAKEDRRSAQMQAKSNKILRKIDQLIGRLDVPPR